MYYLLNPKALLLHFITIGSLYLDAPHTKIQPTASTLKFYDSETGGVNKVWDYCENAGSYLKYDLLHNYLKISS
jgi:hypothetical protein